MNVGGVQSLHDKLQSGVHLAPDVWIGGLGGDVDLSGHSDKIHDRDGEEIEILDGLNDQKSDITRADDANDVIVFAEDGESAEFFLVHQHEGVNGQSVLFDGDSVMSSEVERLDSLLKCGEMIIFEEEGEDIKMGDDVSDFSVFEDHDAFCARSEGIADLESVPIEISNDERVLFGEICDVDCTCGEELVSDFLGFEIVDDIFVIRASMAGENADEEGHDVHVIDELELMRGRFG